MFLTFACLVPVFIGARVYLRGWDPSNIMSYLLPVLGSAMSSFLVFPLFKLIFYDVPYVYFSQLKAGAIDNMRRSYGLKTACFGALAAGLGFALTASTHEIAKVTHFPYYLLFYGLILGGLGYVLRGVGILTFRSGAMAKVLICFPLLILILFLFALAAFGLIAWV